MNKLLNSCTLGTYLFECFNYIVFFHNEGANMTDLFSYDFLIVTF